MENYEEQLNNLRDEIDKIDDALHENLVKRTKIVLEIAKVKRSMPNSDRASAWHPAREVRILRRLLGKDSGGFPKTSIFRIWREMFGALTNLQKPFIMAVFMPQRGAGFLEIARDQFGAYSPFSVCGSVGQIIRELTENKASVGVIPIDDSYDSTSPWWIKMLPSNIKVVARLPLIGPGEGRGGGKEAYVLAVAPHENTGDDRSLMVIEVKEEAFSIGSLKEKLKTVDIEIERICSNYTVNDKEAAYLAEVQGYISDDDPRIKKLYSSNKNNFSKITIIGGYAVPLDTQA
ncbi:MAG: chorismate mutase [Alphaproteobacteria bacterium]